MFKAIKEFFVGKPPAPVEAAPAPGTGLRRAAAAPVRGPGGVTRDAQARRAGRDP